MKRDSNTPPRGGDAALLQPQSAVNRQAAGKVIGKKRDEPQTQRVE